MKNERNKKWLVYAMCMVLTVTSLTDMGMASGSMVYASESGDATDGGGEGTNSSPNPTGSEMPVATESPAPAETPGAVEYEEVATGAAIFFDNKTIEENLGKAILTEKKDMGIKANLFLVPEQKENPEVTPEVTDIPKSSSVLQHDKTLKKDGLQEDGDLKNDGTLNDDKDQKQEIKNENIDMRWLVGDDKREAGEEFMYGQKYCVEFSFQIDKKIEDDFFVEVNDERLTLKKNENGKFVSEKYVGNFLYAELDRDKKTLTVTKEYPILGEYTHVYISGLKSEKENLQVIYVRADGTTDIADSIIFDVDKAEKDSNKLKNKLRITLKPENGRYKFSENVIFSNCYISKEQISFEQEKLVISDYGQIVTVTDGEKTMEKEGNKAMKKEGDTSGISCATFRGYTDDSSLQASEEKKSDSGENQPENKITKTIYNYTVSYNWRGKKVTGNQLKNEKIVRGKNNWEISVQEKGDAEKGETAKGEVKIASGIIYGYRQPEVKDLYYVAVNKEQNKKTSILKEAIVKDVFGDDISANECKITSRDKSLSVSKDNKEVTVNIKTVNDSNMQENPVINVSITELNGQNMVAVPVKIKKPEQGTVTFRKRKRGKRIDCIFNKKAKKIAKIKNKGNVKKVKVCVEFQSKGSKKDEYTAAYGVMKKIFSPAVPKSKCYITYKKPFKIKRFRVWAEYTLTNQKKVRVPMKIKGNYK